MRLRLHPKFKIYGIFSMLKKYVRLLACPKPQCVNQWHMRCKLFPVNIAVCTQRQHKYPRVQCSKQQQQWQWPRQLWCNVNNVRVRVSIRLHFARRNARFKIVCCCHGLPRLRVSRRRLSGSVEQCVRKGTKYCFFTQKYAGQQNIFWVCSAWNAV